MTETIQISKAQARRFLLAYQGLRPPYGLQGKDGVLAFVRRVGCIQFDPLNIVSQNPDLVLQARVAGFRPRMLQELLYEDRKLLDGWDKNMAIYGVEDWPYFERRRLANRENFGKSAEAVQAVLEQVRAEVAERGPLSSLELDLNQTVDWSWAPTRLSRAALESMYFWGELIVHHKVNTRKVYDFTHRHLPEELIAAPDPNGTFEAYQDWYVHRRIGSVGLLWNRTSEAWLGVAGLKTAERQAALDRLVGQGKALPVRVEGVGVPLYLRSQDQALLEAAQDDGENPGIPAILAPLDNLLWDRRLVKELFDFDYRWEVYKPAAERRHGYYVLPVLRGDRFIGRFEPGYDKKKGVLTVKNWWWEEGVQPDAEMRASLRGCFERFLEYLGGKELEAGSVNGEQ